jgi:hypothetical protein
MAQTSLATICFSLGPVICLASNQRFQGYLINLMVGVSAIAPGHLENRLSSSVNNLVSPDIVLCSPEVGPVAGKMSRSLHHLSWEAVTDRGILDLPVSKEFLQLNHGFSLVKRSAHVYHHRPGVSPAGRLTVS